MLGTTSLYRALLLSFGILSLTALIAVSHLGVANQTQQMLLRDERLAARAAQASAVLRELGDATTAPDWSEAAPQALAKAAIDYDFGALNVMVPAPDVPSRWRLVAELPSRSEARFPLSDPSVQRTLAGGRELVRWFDPAGVQWCSLLLPVRNRSGTLEALIEVRSPEQMPIGAPLWWAIGLLVVGGTMSAIGLAFVIRGTRAAMASLSKYLTTSHRDGVDDPSSSAGHLSKLGPLAGSLQRAAQESTTRIIRQKREVTELRSQAASLLSADRAKTTLVVALCRSLRQTVDSLRASSLLLSQTRIDRLQRDYVETLQAGCGDMMTRIGDVLDFALLEAECLSLEQRPLRPRLVLEEALLIIAERYAQLPIELAWYAEDSVPERVIGDVARVRQVLVNLIGLAASTAEEGTVVVHVVAEADHRLTFRISLMGVTMTAERIRLLLEGAISSDSSSDRLQGEGLGLVLGKRLAQAMGGSLSIERCEGEDIELVCTLRIMPDDVAPEQSLALCSVVVAHERPATRRMLTAILTRAGAQVVAVDGQQELRNHLATGAQPAAVILGTRVAPDINADADAPEVIVGVRSLAANWPVVLVVDPVHRGFSPELRAAGAVGLVVMPVRQQALLAAVGDAVSGIKRDSSLQTTLPTPQYAPRVLVVEDNEINRLVLLRMLERLGIQPDLAENGQEAVDRVHVATSSQQPYSLILMDCMMPVMDGLTATKTIREGEEAESGVWIIAVTANAMANDRARCLGAGMNDYLAKPVTPLALQEALNRWQQAAGLPRSASRRFPELAASAVVSAPVVAAENPVPVSPDKAAHDRPLQPCVPIEAPAADPAKPQVDFSGLKMLAKLAGPGALSEVVACFIGESAKMLGEVQAAAEANDCPALRASAHKMKGSCGTVGLLAVQAHVGSIEAAAKDGDLVTGRTLVDTLPPLFATSLGHLRAFRDGV